MADRDGDDDEGHDSPTENGEEPSVPDEEDADDRRDPELPDEFFESDDGEGDRSATDDDAEAGGEDESITDLPDEYFEEPEPPSIEDDGRGDALDEAGDGETPDEGETVGTYVEAPDVDATRDALGPDEPDDDGETDADDGDDEPDVPEGGMPPDYEPPPPGGRIASQGTGGAPPPDDGSDGATDAESDSSALDQQMRSQGRTPPPPEHRDPDGEPPEPEHRGGGRTAPPDNVPGRNEGGSEPDVTETASNAFSGVADAFGGMGGETAPDDEEMPLTDHVEEMALRTLSVLLVVFGVGGVTLFYADDLINFLWYAYTAPGMEACPGMDCPRSRRPRLFSPLALVFARLKVAGLAGFVVALPVAVYQTYRFMRPGLYPRERRYYLAAVPTSLVLAAIGVAFAHFAVLPALFQYFMTYSERAADLAFSLSDTFGLMVLLLGFFALVFQIPLLIMLAVMMNVTSRQWLADRRLYFWAGFATVAFLFGPDPTGMAPLIMAATMIALFDGTLILLRWTGEGSLLPTAEAAAARRGHAWLAAGVVAYLVSPGPIPGSYHDQLPSLVTETIAAQNLTTFTPVIIGAVLIGLFEGGAYLLRKYGHSGEYVLRARLWIDQYRIPVWLALTVVGYWGSPRPLFIRVVQDVALRPALVGAVAVGLVVAYELAILGLRYRETGSPLPTSTAE